MFKMKNYSADKVEIIEKFIQNSEVDIYEELDDVAMIVDWREYDDAIVEYCENILETGYLSAELKDADNKQGFTITIHYGDKSLLIPYQGDGADRDTTLWILNEILHPDYEIRYCIASEGSDTGLFIPLSKTLWHYLDMKYTIKMDELFRRFEANSVFFG